MNRMLRSIAVAAPLLLATLSFSQTVDNKQASFSAHIQKAQEYLAQKRADLAIPELQAAEVHS